MNLMESSLYLLKGKKAYLEDCNLHKSSNSSEVGADVAFRGSILTALRPALLI